MLSAALRVSLSTVDRSGGAHDVGTVEGEEKAAVVVEEGEEEEGERAHAHQREREEKTRTDANKQ